MTNWRDLKPGDRVRVTFEEPVHGADAATWELLSRPLKVGPAKFKMCGVLCDVLALHGKWAWIKYVNTGVVGTSLAEMLVNIDEEPQP